MTDWNLPPGCTNADVDRAFGYQRDPSDLAENVRALLNKARAPWRVVAVILEEIAEWEEEERQPDPDDARADYEFERDR